MSVILFLEAVASISFFMALLTMLKKQLLHFRYQDQVPANRQQKPRCHVRKPRRRRLVYRRGVPRHHLRLPPDPAPHIRASGQGEIHRQLAAQPEAAQELIPQGARP